jgi:hypothetical protein
MNTATKTTVKTSVPRLAIITCFNVMALILPYEEPVSWP